MSSIDDDVRAFAALAARHDDPFADRARVLAAAGIDAATWAQFRQSWSARLAAAGAAELARAYADAYAAEQRRMERGASIAAPARSHGPERRDPSAAAIDRTGDAVPALGGDALPFASEPDAANQVRVRFAGSAPSAAIGETAEIGALTDDQLEALPFVAAPTAAEDDEPPHLTLEHYASMCAELQVNPAHAEGIRRRYGLAELSDQQREDGAWAKRMAGDSRLTERWRQLVGQYQAWLVDRRG